VPHSVRNPSGGGTSRLSLAAGTTPATPPPAPADATGRTLRELEMEHILRVLDKHNGSKTAAAAELGISLKTMYNKLNQLQEERKSAG
jgi:DNA-binding NtrC family response regulator